MIHTKSELTATLQTIRAKSPGMSPDQYKAAISAIGLSQRKAGSFFGMAHRQGQRWAYGEAPIPLIIQWCLEFMVGNKIKAEDMQNGQIN